MLVSVADSVAAAKPKRTADRACRRRPKTEWRAAASPDPLSLKVLPLSPCSARRTPRSDTTIPREAVDLHRRLLLLARRAPRQRVLPNRRECGTATGRPGAARTFK